MHQILVILGNPMALTDLRNSDWRLAWTLSASGFAAEEDAAAA